MSAKSDYLEAKFINHIFRTTKYTGPTNVYIALFTVAEADDGATGTEVTGGSYARVTVAAIDANWDAPGAADGLTANTGLITFPTPTADWGAISHFAIMDAATSGNLLYHGALGNPKTVNNGDPAPKFLAGTLVVTEA